METVTSYLFLILGVYLFLGILFSIFFLSKGMKKLDPGTEDTSFMFKVLLFPGIVALWIVLFIKWLKIRKI